jgi:ribosome biogenesis protein UTP30
MYQLGCSVLPHCPLPDPYEVCLFVKDLQKGIKADHEPTLQHFQALLKEHGVANIAQVIPLRELKVEYKQYESKAKLCHRFDRFLADERIVRFLPPFLGKAFYKRKR